MYHSFCHYLFDHQAECHIAVSEYFVFVDVLKKQIVATVSGFRKSDGTKIVPSKEMMQSAMAYTHYHLKRLGVKQEVDLFIFE